MLYRVFIKYCVFSLKFFYFSELCQFCCSADFLSDTEEEQRNILKSSEKTQYLMNTLYNILADRK